MLSTCVGRGSYELPRKTELIRLSCLGIFHRIARERVHVFFGQNDDHLATHRRETSRV